MRTLMLLFVLSGQAPRVEETIVVTGERLEQPASETAAAITVLDRADLASLTTTHLGDALRFVPGLQIISVDSLGNPMISSRGFFGAGEVEYVQLIVDGAAAGDVESGNADWRSIPVESIERVEILRGAGSSMFGDVALGGVIQVFRRPATRISLSLASFQTLRAHATVAEERFHGTASMTTTGGFRDHSSGREINGSAGLRSGRALFQLDAMQRDRKDPGARSAAQLQNDPFGSDPMFRFDGDETQRLRLSARVPVGAAEVTAHAHHRQSKTVRTILLGPGFGDRALRRLDTAGAGLAASREWRIGAAARVAAGGDLSRDLLDTRYFRFDESVGHLLAGSNGNRVRGAAFVTAEWRATPRLRIAAGGRWDRMADDFEDIGQTADEALSPRLGVTYALGDATTGWINVSRAFKAPTLEQRFDPRPFPDFAGGTFTISNDALRAQNATTFEAGARGSWWEMVAYEMRVDDEIDFDIGTFRYQNIGRSLHRGVELALRAAADARLQPAVTYTWTRVEARDGPHRGRQLKNIAEHLLRGVVRLRSPIEMTLVLEHARGRFLDDSNQFPLDPSTIVDVTVSRPIGGVRVALEVRNLLDERYAPLGFSLGEPYYFPGAGRSVAATVSWRPENGGSS